MPHRFTLPIRPHPRALLSNKRGSSTPKNTTVSVAIPQRDCTLSKAVEKCDTGTETLRQTREKTKNSMPGFFAGRVCDPSAPDEPGYETTWSSEPPPYSPADPPYATVLQHAQDDQEEPSVTRIRSTSSSYPTVGISSTRVQSPMSEQRINILSLSNLTQLGHFPGSSSNRSRSVSDPSSTQEAINEAAAVTLQWRGERVPLESHRRFEMLSSPSPEIYPEDSASSRQQCRETQDSTEETYVDLESVRRVSDCSELNQFKSQYDGATDTPHEKSQVQSIQPGQIRQGVKRKASSIFSPIKPLAKQARTEIKKKATEAYYEGTRRFSVARETMKRQHREEKRQYAAWKALRRRQRPGDAIKGKIKKGFGTFSLERSRYGHKMWWKDGVEKYHAPEWMKFDVAFKKECGLK
ncbi:hypothetical protein B0T10DRAFT_603003 [Thelonectria olida]|uniref:Uncharacterized protein n=1 Tax=Thelonectria olida TaxID=1576542 RepID=A0A9P8WCF6_9HYPO|nr:hypothetical protein B0T10DRAFT_603003 [Thelonectria olida]